MTGTFSVKNFEKFQHYKDRSPPWIKLYNELLDDYDFGLLPDASRWHLIAIWLLASRLNNQIPLDPEWVRKRISSSTPVDLTILRNAGFIEFNQGRSKMLAKRKQLAMPEREGETQEEGEKKVPLASERFEEFWDVCPKKTGKDAAEKAWAKAIQLASPEIIIAAMKAYGETQAGKDPSYIKTPGPWLNGKRWRDEGSTPKLVFENTDENGWRNRLRVFRDKALWSPKWGPKPGEIDCKCPAAILEQDKAA